MGFRISTNISAIQARRQQSVTKLKLDKAFAQLASGSRINKAADDAAGLSMGSMLGSAVVSIKQANRNARDGVSMLQVAEGGLNEVGNILTRVRELGVQASSDTLGDVERGFVQKEVHLLKLEMDRISATTTWGKTKLLDGESKDFEFQVGIRNNDFEDRIVFDATQNNSTLESFGLEGMDFSDKSNAQESLAKLDEAMIQLNGMRSNIGAIENRLHHGISNQEIYLENLMAAKSRIMDTDVAEASALLSQKQILMQSAVSVQAQANQSPSLALKLLS
ncbi:MAG: flagellin FliC [Bdellovibrionaceae bacterium]|jgi:flagellin|nr:flagellin FliC [Pseudobdellovibrionaceae bacterium]